MGIYKRIIDGLLGFCVAVLAFIGLGAIVNRKGNKQNVNKKVDQSNSKIDNMPIDNAINAGNDLIRDRRKKRG